MLLTAVICAAAVVGTALAGASLPSQRAVPATEGLRPAHALTPAVAPAVVPGPFPPPAGRWLAPVTGRVVRGFEPPPARWMSGHRGVDFAASAADPIRAPASGTIGFAGQVAGKPVVTVHHAGGLRSTFEPATTGLSVGDDLAAGEVVGRVARGGSDAGSGSHCDRGCLHWGVRRGSDYVDPLRLLRPIVLKPYVR